MKFKIIIIWTDDRETTYEYSSVELAHQHFEGFVRSKVVKRATLIENKTVIRQYESTSKDHNG